jgi:hypothetical protein
MVSFGRALQTLATYSSIAQRGLLPPPSKRDPCVYQSSTASDGAGTPGDRRSSKEETFAWREPA